MTHEPMDDAAPEGPRRRTYEPPSEEAVFTGSFPVIDDAEESPHAVGPEVIPDPPVRTSLPEAAILEKFRNPSAGSTSEMIAELERQVQLKEQEDESFEAWANIVRDIRGPEAEPYIARERIIFDGGDPGPLDEVVIPESTSEHAEEDHLEHIDPDDSAALDTERDLELPSEPESESESPEASGEGEPAAGADEDVSGDEEPASEPESSSSELSEEDSPKDDHWPLAQADSPESEETARPHAQSLPGALASWFGVGLPLAAVMAGGYFSFRGLGITESLVLLGALALVVGMMVGVLSHQGFRRGLSTGDLLRGSFGNRGALAPALLISLLQLAAVVFLVWWASDVLVDIISGAGLWPYERWIGSAGAWALLLGVVAALSVVGPRVLRAALLASSVSALVALVVVMVLAAPAFQSPLDWSWSAGWMTVVSTGSLVLSLATIVVVFVAADLATLQRSSSSRSGGVLSALALALPFVALAGASSWLAQSSPVLSLGLLANPVGALTEGAPAWYPSIAVVAAVIPVVALAALLTRSASLVAPTLPMPGSWRVHTAAVLGLVAVLGTLGIVFRVDLQDVVGDVALTLGVIAVALAAILAKEWAVVGSTKPIDPPALRVVPLVAFVVPVGLGLGLVESSVGWLSWQGYLFPLLELAGLMDLSPAQPGVLVSFVLAGVISGFGAMAQWVRARKSSDVNAL